jgi:hypothetical protein
VRFQIWRRRSMTKLLNLVATFHEDLDVEYYIEEHALHLVLK